MNVPLTVWIDAFDFYWPFSFEDGVKPLKNLHANGWERSRKYAVKLYERMVEIVHVQTSKTKEQLGGKGLAPGVI